MWLSYAFVITFLHMFMLGTAKTVGIIFLFDNLSPNLTTRNLWSLIIELVFLMKATYRIIENNDYQGTYL